jgi:hypothetical protein
MLSLLRQPKSLFLIDAIGAFITAFLLFMILSPCEAYFGAPKEILRYLSIIAAVYAVYSFSCFLLLKKQWSPFLKIISMANLFYCGLTVSFVIYYSSRLKMLGFAYFLGEILLIVCLACFEWRVSVTTKK